MSDIWQVRNVPEDVRKAITTYASVHHISVAEALSILTMPTRELKEHDHGIIKSGEFVVSGDLRAAYEALKARYE